LLGTHIKYLLFDINTHSPKQMIRRFSFCDTSE